MQNIEGRTGRLVKKRKTQVAEKAISVSQDKLEDPREPHPTKKDNSTKRVTIPVSTDPNYKNCFVDVCCRASECPANIRQAPQKKPSGYSPDMVIHDLRFGTILPPNRSPYLLLVVFSSIDPTCEALTRAGRKLGFDVMYCSTYDLALEEYRGRYHDLIIVDARSPKIDYDTLCRSIRNTKGSQHTAMVAVVNRSAFESDDVEVSSLLDSGYNRCSMATQNILVWVNELIQLRYSDLRPLAQYSTTQVLFAAIETCEEPIVITDDLCRIQYVNSASMKYFGFPHAEILGKTLHGQLAVDPVEIDVMCSRLFKGRTWKGELNLKRKQMKAICVKCTAVPISCAGRSPTHFAIVLGTDIDNGMDVVKPVWSNSSMPRKFSIDSRIVEYIHRPPEKELDDLAALQQKRASIDTRSLTESTKPSLSRMAGLPLEAPIFKIINLICQAEEKAGSNVEVIATLDKVINLLSNTELFAPYTIVPREGLDEAADLVTALITQRSPDDASSMRRLSVASALLPTRRTAKVKHALEVPSEVLRFMDNALSWDFDTLGLERVTKNAPLVFLGYKLVEYFDVCNALDCDETTMYNYLVLVEAKYRKDNPYHNATHAADVMQAVASYMERERLKMLMTPLDRAASLIAAACHDLDHPGKSSAFLTNSNNILAILYNDISVLEMHHSALTFQLALARDKANIFKNLNRETYRLVRKDIVEMILATEMTKHFEHLAKFVSACTPLSDVEDSMHDYINMNKPENLSLVKRMMIKCADVSNPARSFPACVEWTLRITEEYFQQTEEERNKGLPVVMPMFDRSGCSIPKAQIGFYDFIINDMVEAWDAFIDLPEMVKHMRSNYLRWKELDDQGHSTIDDIRKLQM